MNPLLERLQPYPFEKLRALLAGATPAAGLAPINLSIGEPKHPTPALVRQALADALDGLSTYPATAGLPAMRQAIRLTCARARRPRMLDASMVEGYGIRMSRSAKPLHSVPRPTLDYTDRAYGQGAHS